MKYSKVLFAALGIAVLAEAPSLIEKLKSAPPAPDDLRDAAGIVEDLNISMSDIVRKGQKVENIDGKPVLLPGSIQKNEGRRLSKEEMQPLIELAADLYTGSGKTDSLRESVRKGERLFVMDMTRSETPQEPPALETIEFRVEKKGLPKKYRENNPYECVFKINPHGEIGPEVLCPYFYSTTDSLGYRGKFHNVERWKLSDPDMLELFEQELSFWMKYKYKGK